jgi:hypothetical protein
MFTAFSGFFLPLPNLRVLHHSTKPAKEIETHTLLRCYHQIFTFNFKMDIIFFKQL